MLESCVPYLSSKLTLPLTCYINLQGIQSARKLTVSFWKHILEIRSKTCDLVLPTVCASARYVNMLPPTQSHMPCARNVYMAPQPQSHIDRYCVALAMYASALPPNQPHGMCGVICIVRLTGEPCVCRVSGHAADLVMFVGHLAMASSKCYYTVSYCVSWKHNNTNNNEYIWVHRHQLVCFAAALKGWRRNPIPSLLSQKWTLLP